MESKISVSLFTHMQRLIETIPTTSLNIQNFIGPTPILPLHIRTKTCGILKIISVFED